MVSKGKVAIVSRPGKDERLDSGLLLTNLVDWLRAHEYTPLIDFNTVWHLRSILTWTRPEVLSDDELAVTQDLALVIVLGGDGTLLGAARKFATLGVPLLSVNMGNLGFLSEVTVSDLYPALDSWEAGKHVMDVRSMLEVYHFRPMYGGGAYSSLGPFVALNEAVVSQYSTGKLGEFLVELGGLHSREGKIAQFRANGVIVSTPTGSTAYNLASGGPIVHPDTDALVMTPICPHLLTLRPLVVRGDSEITIRVMTGEATLSVDGTDPITVTTNDHVICRRSEHTVNLVRLHSSGFFEAMRSKMSWGER